MILIDKEKFIEEVRKRKYSAASIKLIEEQPEVIAIPIEWLKRYEITKGQEVRLQDAINDWEKENARD